MKRLRTLIVTLSFVLVVLSPGLSAYHVAAQTMGASVNGSAAADVTGAAGINPGLNMGVSAIPTLSASTLNLSSVLSVPSIGSPIVRQAVGVVPAAAKAATESYGEEVSLPLAVRKGSIETLKTNLSAPSAKSQTTEQQAADARMQFEGAALKSNVTALTVVKKDRGMPGSGRRRYPQDIKRLTLARLSPYADSAAANRLRGNWNFDEVLGYAAVDGDTKGLKEILDASGVDVNVRYGGATLLMLTANRVRISGHAAIVAELLRRGADPAAVSEESSTREFIVPALAVALGKTALQLAQGAVRWSGGNASNARRTVLRLLESAEKKRRGDAEPRDPGTLDPTWNDLLVLTALGGAHWELRGLLRRGAELNGVSCDGYTPLTAAIHFGASQTLRALIALGADLSAKDGFGRTPLDTARERGDADIIEILKHPERVEAYWATETEAEFRDRIDRQWKGRRARSTRPSAAAADPWKTLGLKPGASKAEVKHAYRILARKLHPDANFGQSRYVIEAQTKRLMEVIKAYREIQELRR